MKAGVYRCTQLLHKHSYQLCAE